MTPATPAANSDVASRIFESGEALAAAQPLAKPITLMIADAKGKWPLDHGVDCVVTSPPYWQKRNYGRRNQIGQESDPEEYARNIAAVLGRAKDNLTDAGNIFLNIGDTYRDGELTGIPHLVEREAKALGLQLRNRIVWTKDNGIPEPRARRLASRSEFILHFSKTSTYYYDLHGYANVYGKGANPGDVWRIPSQLSTGTHLAPFPRELAERAITLGCPLLYDEVSHTPVVRIVSKTFELDSNRQQARRALEIAKEKGLTKAHLKAIQAVGIADAGKAQKFQSGTGQNSDRVMRLAREAKRVLGGYFREFTFARRKTTGWKLPEKGRLRRGIVVDPFAGTCTTLAAAALLERAAVGLDVRRWREATATIAQLGGEVRTAKRKH